jgi:four helix bundle protein
MSNGEFRREPADFDAFWGDYDHSPVMREEPDSPVYDLGERTARFGEAIIDFAKLIPETAITDRLIRQIVGCGTSVGANYCEADDEPAKKDFLLRINTCRKEAKETKFFLRMIVRAVPPLKDDARILWREAKELNLIFSKIRRNSK